MDNQAINYLAFFILLLTIIYMGCVDRNVFEKMLGTNHIDTGFNSPPVNPNIYVNKNKYDKLEGTHYRIEKPLVSRIVNETNKGWKQLYKDKYLKGNVNYGDSFAGTVTRNYLDNMEFFLN